MASSAPAVEPRANSKDTPSRGRSENDTGAARGTSREASPSRVSSKESRRNSESGTGAARNSESGTGAAREASREANGGESSGLAGALARIVARGPGQEGPPSSSAPRQRLSTADVDTQDANDSSPFARASVMAGRASVIGADAFGRAAGAVGGVTTSLRTSVLGSTGAAPTRASSASYYRDSMRVSLNGNTLLEHGVGAFTGAHGSFSASGTAANYEFKEAEREFAKERRGEGPQFHRLSLYDKVDVVADTVMTKASEPWWMSCCSDVSKSKKGRRGSQRDGNTPEDEGGHKHDDEDGDESAWFGFPKFEDAGYCILPNSEMQWPDKTVCDKLRLQKAIHKKTSIERLCLCRHKAKLAPGVSKQHILTVGRSLKKLEHVNILRVTDVFEDISNLYFLYENYPAVTLFSAMEHHKWTEEQTVNLVREVCAAAAYALSLGIHHLGWTLAHIFLPATCWREDPSVAKVFGFGLMGLFTDVDGSDLVCWSPEAVEGYLRYNEGFVSKFEKKQLCESDAWSLGVIAYSAVARRPPFMGNKDSMCRAIMHGDWSFGLAFDEVDREAKELVESLLQKIACKRIKVDQSFFSPWIRRRWKPPGDSKDAYEKLKTFCTAPLPKRLFGRFLVKFLDADHLRVIAKTFYALDQQGDGVIDAKDLKLAAKVCDRTNESHSDLQQITAWMLRDGQTAFSLHHFAETMAEEVIDGRALRHSFESLDDDGSEQITAQELYDTLVQFNGQLKMEQVLKHITETEGKNNGGELDGDSQKDHKLDYKEYVQLFPVRLERLKEMEERVSRTQKYAAALEQRFEDVREHIESWIKDLEKLTSSVRKLSLECGDKKGAQTVADLKNACRLVAERLKHPPGPAAYDEHRELTNLVSKAKKKVEGRRGSKGAATTVGAADKFGFDSFMQDQAIHAFWATLVEGDRRTLKACMHHDPQTGQWVADYFRAHDAGQNVVKKVEEVIEWGKMQTLEYSSFLEVLTDSEASMPGLVYSCRGRRVVQGEYEDEKNDEMQEHGNAGPKDADTQWFSSIVSRCTGSR